MKKLFTLLFAAGLVTAASAQSGDRYCNENRRNDYQTSRYSGYDNDYSDQYYRQEQRERRSDYYQMERRRQWIERQRYEMMMRNRARYYSQSRYDRYPVYGYSRQQPVLQLSIGIGGRR